MNISRNIALKIQFVLDELVPPLVRDSKWFIWIPFKLMFGEKADVFLGFKDKAPFMSVEEFETVYRETSSAHIERETDINQECLGKIDSSIVGNRILDVACGRGFLCSKLSQDHEVVGVDIVVSNEVVRSYPAVMFKEASIENLPFADKHFDTVISAHTLEHVLCPESAVRELRRVTARRLIVIVPKQRPYKYTFDLHINFFPHRYDLLGLMSPRKAAFQCIDCGGDWFYIEDMD